MSHKYYWVSSIDRPGNHHPKPLCIDNMETLQTALSSHSKLLSNQISVFRKPSTYRNEEKKVLNLPYSYIPIVFLHPQSTNPKMFHYSHHLWLANHSKLTFNTSTFKMSFIFTATVSGSYPCIWSCEESLDRAAWTRARGTIFAKRLPTPASVLEADGLEENLPSASVPRPLAWTSKSTTSTSCSAARNGVQTCD